MIDGLPNQKGSAKGRNTSAPILSPTANGLTVANPRSITRKSPMAQVRRANPERMKKVHRKLRQIQPLGENRIRLNPKKSRAGKATATAP